MPQIGKNGFGRVVDLPPAAVPDDSTAQTVGDTLQRRFDSLSNPYGDDLDARDKTHPFLVSYLRSLLALAVNF